MSKRAKRPAAKRPRAVRSWAVWFRGVGHPYSTHPYKCDAECEADEARRVFDEQPSIVPIEIRVRPAREATKRPEARG